MLLTEIAEMKQSSLRKLSFQELALRPPYEDEQVSAPDEAGIVATWIDVISDYKVRVVVQAYSPGWLGAGSMYASGFEMTSCGAIRDLRGDELYEFI